jgi:hypothetical protein
MLGTGETDDEVLQRRIISGGSVILGIRGRKSKKFFSVSRLL